MQFLRRWVIRPFVWTLLLCTAATVRSQRLRSSTSESSLSTTTTEASTLVKQTQHRQLISSVTNLITSFQLAKAKLYEKLKQDYGEETFNNFFFFEEDGQTVSAGRAYHIPATGRGGISWWRMQRKLMMKILKFSIEGSKQPFVWATGGHSASGKNVVPVFIPACRTRG